MGRGMVGRRFLALSAGALALGSLWFPYAAYQDIRAHASSQANCEDDGLGCWKLLLADYLEDHNGALPSPVQRKSMAYQLRRQSSSAILNCNTGAEYRWAEGVHFPSGSSPVPLVWCGKPHGFWHRWRNVLYSDLSLRQVPEEEAGRW